MARKNGTSGDGDGIEDPARLLAAAGEGGDGSDENGGDGTDSLDTAEEVARMKACFARLCKVYNFKPGQLVQWKKGLKNKRTPCYGEPIIVMELLATPTFDNTVKDAGSPYFREPLSFVAGELDGDGDIICYHYDARRFEPYLG
jgi:hypothetical protein